MSPFVALGFGPRGRGLALLQGALMTLFVATAGLLIGAAIGSLVAWAKLSRARLPAAIGEVYAAIFRGVPELLVVYFVYFGSSALLTSLAHLAGYGGFLGVPAFLAGALSVGVISGAYQAELYRGAFLAIPRGELEAAARACGMGGWVMFRRIVAPQVVRFALPGLNNLWQVALKDSSLISVTGLAELMRVSQVASGSTRQPFTFYLAGGALYLVLTVFSNRLFEFAEARAALSRRQAGRKVDSAFLSSTFWSLMDALPLTLEVWLLSVVFGGLLALALTWARASAFKPLVGFARAYVFVFRGTPLLVQLFVVYYGVASFAVVRASLFWPFLREAFSCAVLALALCTAAYQSEIFRMALAAIPPGQIESARACGMSGPTLFARIVFPIALRHALPAYTTELISMMKSTALVSLVTLWDVMSVALKIRNDTLVTYTPLLIAGAIYFVVNYILARAFATLEYVLSPHLRGRPTPAKVADVL